MSVTTSQRITDRIAELSDETLIVLAYKLAGITLNASYFNEVTRPALQAVILDAWQQEKLTSRDLCLHEHIEMQDTIKPNWQSGVCLDCNVTMQGNDQGGYIPTI